MRLLYGDFPIKLEDISDSNIVNDEKQIGDAEVEADELENAEDDWEADSDEVELEDDSSSDEARLSFLLGFIKTFVVHLTAKRALERYSFKIKDRAAVNISLLSVERSCFLIPVGSWSEMKGILKESFSSDTFDSESFSTAAKAIKCLEDKIQTYCNHDLPYTVDSDCRKAVRCFNDITSGNLEKSDIAICRS